MLTQVSQFIVISYFRMTHKSVYVILGIVLWLSLEAYEIGIFQVEWEKVVFKRSFNKGVSRKWEKRIQLIKPLNSKSGIQVVALSSF